MGITVEDYFASNLFDGTVQVVSGLPPVTSVVDGTVVYDKSAGKFYIALNGSWVEAPQERGQAGGFPLLDASGKLAAPDSYMYRGYFDFDNVDWNTKVEAGLYKVGNATSGAGANQPPAIYKFGHLIVFTTDDNQATWGVTQIYIPHQDSDPFIYIRQKWQYLSAWMSWKTLGVHYGSNANGSYVRFADGTQICWGSVTLTYSSVAVLDKVWTFPAAFLSNPSVQATDNMLSTGMSARHIHARYRGSSLTPTSVAIEVIHDNDGFVSGNTVRTDVLAIGRWK